jgi:hypothetical protein
MISSHPFAARIQRKMPPDPGSIERSAIADRLKRLVLDGWDI